MHFFRRTEAFNFEVGWEAEFRLGTTHTGFANVGREFIAIQHQLNRDCKRVAQKTHIAMSDFVGKIVAVDGCDALVLEEYNNRAIYVPRVANIYDPLAVNARTLDHLRRCPWGGYREDDAVCSDIRQFIRQELQNSIPTATG
nr:hypothetical protein [Pandoravirus aubagnensis]